jgi:pyruvate/2-oxoglutarate dehydrogenase complex dihydrolipoamide dehydrogenase (E3) component
LLAAGGERGLTEAKAKESGRKIKVGKFPFIGNGKAIALGEADGLDQDGVRRRHRRALGAHMIGAEVTELIQGYVIAKDGEADRPGTGAHHLPASDSVRDDARSGSGGGRAALHI